MANIVSTGGWALVFAVEDVATGKEYALKVSLIYLFLQFIMLQSYLQNYILLLETNSRG